MFSVFGKNYFFTLIKFYDRLNINIDRFWCCLVFLLFFRAKNRKTLNDALCGQKGAMNDVADDFQLFSSFASCYWGDLQFWRFLTILITLGADDTVSSWKEMFVVLFLQSEAILEVNFCGNRQKIGRKTLICDFGLYIYFSPVKKKWEMSKIVAEPTTQLKGESEPCKEMSPKSNGSSYLIRKPLDF